MTVFLLCSRGSARVSAKECFVLVVTRKKSERFKVGEAIVTVVKCDNGKVRIGIDAPRDMNIVREELVDGGFGPRTEPRKRGSGKSAPNSIGVCES